MFIFAVDEEDKLCGYICFFPISDSLKEKIENENIMFDDNILPNDITQYSLDKTNNIFLISVALHPQYMGKGIGFNLVREMFAYFELLMSKNYKIGSIYASATSHNGKKLLSKFNFDIIKSYENNNFLMKCNINKYSDMDLYLFFPVKFRESVIKKEEDNEFIELLVKTSKLEIKSLMQERLERKFLGHIKFVPEDDYGNIMDKGFINANLYLSEYRDIGVLTVEFAAISFDPTYILDQASSESLKIFKDTSIDFYSYLGTLGIEVMGNCTHLLVSSQKLDPYYRQFVLYSEAYFNRIGSKIISQTASDDASNNIAQYEFADIFASSVGVCFEFNPLVSSSKYTDRLQKSILMIFINEILALEIASLRLVQNRITTEFDNSPKPAIEIIENLIDNFGKYIVLFEYNCKYPLAKCLMDIVSKKFGIDVMQKNYKNNVEMLNKIVSIRSERLNKVFSKKQDNLFKIISIFTLLLSINNVISLFTEVDLSKKGDFISFIISLLLWGGAVIYLLIIWIKRIKSNIKKKSTN